MKSNTKKWLIGGAIAAIASALYFLKSKPMSLDAKIDDVLAKMHAHYNISIPYEKEKMLINMANGATLEQEIIRLENYFSVSRNLPKLFS